MPFDLLRCPTYTGSTVWQDIYRWAKSKNIKACTATHTRSPGFQDEDGKSVKDTPLLRDSSEPFTFKWVSNTFSQRVERKVHKEHRTACFHSACWDIFIWPLRTFYFFSPLSGEIFCSTVGRQKSPGAFCLLNMPATSNSHISLKRWESCILTSLLSLTNTPKTD